MDALKSSWQVESREREALICAIMGNVNRGDQVIIIEPFLDYYETIVKRAGGEPVFIPLRPVILAFIKIIAIYFNN